jgi:hypothetical protein
MKKAKMRSLFFILTIFMIVCYSNIEATNNDKYVRTFESVEFNNNGANIQLSDGLSLKWIFQDCEKDMLSTWQKGDIIYIQGPWKKKGLFLLNPLSEILYAPYVSAENCFEQLPTIANLAINKINDYVTYMKISLSDGSSWSYRIWDDEALEFFSYWKQGDPVIVVFEESEEDEDWEEEEDSVELINCSLAMSDDDFNFASAHFEESKIAE